MVKTLGTERRNTNCVKWDGIDNKQPHNRLPLWVADMDFVAPDCVRDAISKFNDFGIFGYYTPRESYYESIINWQKSVHNVDIKREWICFSPDVVQAIGWIINGFTNKGDSIMLSSPVYNPFFELIERNERVVVDSKLKLENGKYYLDFFDFEKKIADNNVKLYIFCSPHNPIGRIWKREEIEKVVEICKKHKVYIISDEIHQDFVFPPNEQISMINYVDKYDEIFVLSSASKSFSLASLKNAFAFIPKKENAQKFMSEQLKLKLMFGNTIGYLATEAAYNYGKEWFEEVKRLILKNYEYLKTAFAPYKEYIVTGELEGTYLLWVKFEKFIDKSKVSMFLKEKCEVEVNDGEWFGGDDYKGFFRVNLATSSEIVEEFARRILENVKPLVENIV